MIRVRPQSTVFLCQTPLEADGKNVLDFTDANAQYTYFQSTVKQAFSEYTYVRDSETIDVGVPIDTIRQCNYMFFTNTGFTTKTFYCFITDMTYLNENVTRIAYKTDAFQTWQFDLVRKTCFVEREHVTDDIAGRHTIPENLEIGEYVCNKISSPLGLRGDGSSGRIILGTTIEQIVQDGKLVGGDVEGSTHGGVKTAYVYYAYPTNTDDLGIVLKAFAEAGKLDAIGVMFVAPLSILKRDPLDDYTKPFKIVDTTTSMSIDWNDGTSTRVPIKPTSLNGYTPRNKKLLTYPFCYLLLSNNCGASTIFRYENFLDNECDFDLQGVVTPGCSIIATPKRYNVATFLDSTLSLPAGKFPICGWTSDVYTNWLRQNSLNINLAVAEGIADMTAGATFGIMSGGVTGGGQIVSGLNQIIGTMKQVHQAKFMSPQASGNTNTGDVTFASNRMGFRATCMTIKSEYARVVDQFFDMFGYQVNTVKIPSLKTRANWNYIKTIDCNFDGNIPSRDLETIRSQFNNGVTIWHNPQTMYNYNGSNGVI